MTDAVNLLPKERELIRREFLWRLSSARSLHDGILLKRWATDARKGAPKVPPAVQSLLDRALHRPWVRRLEASGPGPAGPVGARLPASAGRDRRPWGRFG